MADEYKFVSKLREPLISKSYKEDLEYENRRMSILRKRQAKMIKIKHFDSEEEEPMMKFPVAQSTLAKEDKEYLLPYENIPGHMKMRGDIMPYLTSPASPVYKIYNLLASPSRYVATKVKPGGIKGSIFNLIWGVLGTGMLTLPVVCLKNGIILGSILIILGALITMYCGMLIVIWWEKIPNCDSLEQITEFAFGPKAKKIWIYSNIMALLGFWTSYIVVVKSLVPYLLARFSGGYINSFFLDPSMLQILIATFYCIFVLLPLSLPRKMGSLRFMSLFSVIWCGFLVFVIVFIFWLSRKIVPDPVQNFEEAKYFTLTWNGVISTFPFVISSYMYQPMVPAIYKNLDNRNIERMEKVLLRGSYGAVFLYILIAVFGYLTFANNDEQLAILQEKQNILELDYQSNIYIDISMVWLIFTVMSSGPLWMLPCKDTWEEVFYGDNTMTESQNISVTLILTGICFLLAVLLPGIGDVISIVGNTCGPLIGFLFPIMWYLKITKNWSILAIGVLVLTTSWAIYGLYAYVMSKLN